MATMTGGMQRVSSQFVSSHSGSKTAKVICKQAVRSSSLRQSSYSVNQHRLLQDVARTMLCKSSSDFDVDTSAPRPLDQDVPQELGPRDDDVLPNSLADAISAAAEATAKALNRGVSRAQVEILLPEFWDPISGPIFPNRGDQERFWRMTRRFIEGLVENSGYTSVKAIYPDAGVAAMLSHQWQDVNFQLRSLNDRRPVQDEDELVIMLCPDPPGADDCRRLVRLIGEADEAAGRPDRPIVLFNARLASGDVGLGLNARRLRQQFLNNFMVTYSLRPVGEIGSVFRCYPGQWKVFLEDQQIAGRYKLIQESASRPQGDMLDYILSEALEGPQDPNDSSKGVGLMSSVAATIRSLTSFMRALK